MLIPSCKKLLNVIIYHKTDVGIYLHYISNISTFKTELNEKVYFNETNSIDYFNILTYSFIFAFVFCMLLLLKNIEKIPIKNILQFPSLHFINGRIIILCRYQT